MNVYAIGTLFVQLTLGMKLYYRARLRETGMTLRADRRGGEYHFRSDFYFGF